MLTGKYQDGIPANSRGEVPGYERLTDRLTDPESIAKVAKLLDVAAEVDCPLSQLAIVWCLKNANVSTVITGASRVGQVHENMAASRSSKRSMKRSWPRSTRRCPERP